MKGREKGEARVYSRTKRLVKRRGTAAINLIELIQTTGHSLTDWTKLLLKLLQTSRSQNAQRFGKFAGKAGIFEQQSPLCTRITTFSLVFHQCGPIPPKRGQLLNRILRTPGDDEEKQHVHLGHPWNLGVGNQRI